MRISLVIIILSNICYGQSSPKSMLPGNWMGIEMYQDDKSYDGENIFLPNEEFMIISSQDVKIYFYPYSKSDEFKISITDEELIYTVGNKKLRTSYSFTNENFDTLVFTMNFINKSFKKMFSRVTSINERMDVDFATINELDTYGFNPSSIKLSFELDTFHTEYYSGFNFLDSLDFKPYQYLQFINDKELMINRVNLVSISRDYKRIKFSLNGIQNEFIIENCEGTQSFKIVPLSLCSCENIVIPYISTIWADRIRLDMKENSYKYRED